MFSGNVNDENDILKDTIDHIDELLGLGPVELSLAFGLRYVHNS